jgi:hypothetical protein
MFGQTLVLIATASALAVHYTGHSIHGAILTVTALLQ